MKNSNFPIFEFDPYEGDEAIEATRKIQQGWKPSKWSLYEMGLLHPFGNDISNKEIVMGIVGFIVIHLIGITIIILT